MISRVLILADASRTNLDWWFDRLGVLGVLLAAFLTFVFFIGKDLRAWIRSQTQLSNTLNVHIPAQTSSIQDIERRQEHHSEQFAEIRSTLQAICPRPR